MKTNLASTFIITGAGGDIGFSIGKILRDIYPNAILIGTDVHDDHPWNILYDKFFVVPYATDRNSYLNTLSKIVNSVKSISAIIPTTEPELKCFLSLNLKTFKNVRVLMADFNSMNLGFDKFKTYKFLKSNCLPCPWTLLASNGIPKKYPCILKKRSGWGSKNVETIFNAIEAERALSIVKAKDYIFQQFIPDAEQEYTCGLFRGQGLIRNIIIKRKLKGGLTGSGIVVKDSNIDNLLTSMAKKMKLCGSINVQLRVDKNNTPLVFEINPRFSSTVYFRHLLGFKDLQWSLLLGTGNISKKYSIEQSVGKKIYRMWSEIIC